MADEAGINPRYELKQTYSAQTLPELRSWIQAHPAGFSTAYPPRRVNSIYLDTNRLDAFNDHISGVPARRKLRYRWYGEDLQTAHAGQMEIKNKSENVGWKLIEHLDRDFMLAGKSWGSIMGEWISASTGIFRELLAVSRPVLLTVYLREYLVSADQHIRLTIDTGLQGFDQYFSACPNLSFAQPVEEPLIILEIKGDIQYSRELSDILSHFPARANRYSKYVSNLWPDLV